MPGRNPSLPPIGRNPSPRLGAGGVGGGVGGQNASRIVYPGRRLQALDYDPNGLLLADNSAGDVFEWQVDTSTVYDITGGVAQFFDPVDVAGVPLQGPLRQALQWFDVHVINPPPTDSGLVVVAGLIQGQDFAIRSWWGGGRYVGASPRSAIGTKVGLTSGSAAAGIERFIMHTSTRGVDNSKVADRRGYGDIDALDAAGEYVNNTERTGTTDHTTNIAGPPQLFVAAYPSNVGVATTTPTVRFMVRYMLSEPVPSSVLQGSVP